MSVQLISLELIEDNPFQTRARYEAEAIEELAESIAAMHPARAETRGLIQVPPARALNGHYELAAGHTRLRAFRLLAENDPLEWAFMPLDVAPLDDQAMADIAWSENQKRRDLTAVEEAEAMHRAMERFGWTQQEIADRWGLSRPAVANKLRLLQLPDDARDAIQSGGLSERHGRALLAALAKAPEVYESVARDVLPMPVTEDVAAKAREVVRGRYFYKQRNDAQRGAGEGGVCAACGCDLYGKMTHKLPSYSQDYSIKDVLCEPCYRAGTDWGPPSVAETEDLVGRAWIEHRLELRRAPFPLNEVIGKGDPRVVEPVCDRCPERVNDGREAYCRRRECYQAKAENWHGYLEIRLRQAVGDAARTSEGTAGYNLRDGDRVDLALVRDRVCAPGKCERLTFRRDDWGHGIYIQAAPDLPFSYNCSNHNSHAACQRRYLASQESAQVKAAAAAEAETARRCQARAVQMHNRAAGAVATALLAGEDYPQVWAALATGMRVDKPGTTAAECAQQVAAALIGQSSSYVGSINTEGGLELHDNAIRRILQKWGVAMPAFLDDLQAKLERIRGFILGDDGKVREDLTPEQGRGNQENLRGLLAQVEGLASDGVITQTDRTAFAGQVNQLVRALRVSRETD